MADTPEFESQEAKVHTLAIIVAVLGERQPDAKIGELIAQADRIYCAVREYVPVLLNGFEL